VGVHAEAFKVKPAHQ